MKSQWSATAIADLGSIRAYIAQDKPVAAGRVAVKIKDAINRIGSFPLSGRIGRVPETRELVIPGTAYIAAYKIQDDEVLIAAVLHGRQDWPESFETRTGNTA